MAVERSGIFVRVLADEHNDAVADMTKAVLSLSGFSLSDSNRFDCAVIIIDCAVELDAIKRICASCNVIFVLSHDSETLRYADELGFAAIQMLYSFDDLVAAIASSFSGADGTESKLEVDLVDNIAILKSAQVKLTPSEAKILARLADGRTETVARGALLDSIGGEETSNKLDVHISALRKKLREQFGVELVMVRGQGWKLSY